MSGKVYLIGAGCGEADLITLRGLKKLLISDVVLYDSLINQDLINSLPENVEKIQVGKRYNQKSTPQEEINSLIISEAKKGKTVSRLKGGDPFVFGRGSEEALELEKENIEYEVIPGVTSAIAVPASAGIPVTHRQISRSFTVITGSSLNSEDKEEQTQVDYEALKNIGGTIVFLMGLHHLKNITENFIKVQMNPNTPCAVISKGCSTEEKTVRGTIKNIFHKVQEEKLTSPAIIVIGECANFNLKNKKSSEKDFKFNYPQNLKLLGLKIGITGSEYFSKKISKKLIEKGAKIEDLSFLKAIRTQEKFPSLKTYHWIALTSPNGVYHFFEKLKEEKIDIREISHLKFAVIGTGTGDKLLEYGIKFDLMPRQYDSKNLGIELSKAINKKERVLITRAKNGSEELCLELQKTNIDYTDFSLYTLEENPEKKAKVINNEKNIDYLVFGSAMGVKTFFNTQDNKIPSQTIVVCIGEKCASALKEYNIEKVLVAEPYTIDGIIKSIEKDFEDRKNAKA